jgi:nicotinamidase-related amidase
MATTLRDIVGLGQQPTKLSNAALVMIDCQNTYREGIMQLEGVEEALIQAQSLLNHARDLNVPIIHIQHNGGEGSPYDIHTPLGAIADEVAPLGDEAVIVKQYPW